MTKIFSALRAHWDDWVAVLFLALFPLAYYASVTTGARVFFGNDIFRLFYPLRLELARAIAQGRLPLWTPYLQAGFPLHAEGEIGAFYLPNLLSVLILPVHYALSATILLHLMWASCGMYVLMRATKLSVPSATLAAFVFGNSGFFVAHLQHAPHLAVAAWLPWLVWAQKKYWDNQHPYRWAILASIMLGMMLLVSFAPMAILVVIAYSVFALIGKSLWHQELAWRDARLWRHVAIILVLPGLIGGALAAVQLLPTLELMNFSVRGKDLGIHFFTSQSLQPNALTQFVLPFAYLGEPQALNMEFFAYLGVIPLGLAIVAFILHRDQRTLALVAFGLVALTLALGENNPIYLWLYNVPVFNRLRVPARFILLFTFAFAWLAGIGLDALCTRVRQGRGQTIVAGLSAIIAAFVALSLVAASAPEQWLAHWNFLSLIFLALALLVLLLAWRRWLTHAWLAGLFLGLTVCDLGLYAASFLPLQRLVTPAEVVASPRNVRVIGNALPSGRVIAGKFPTVSFNAVRAMLLPNFALQFEREGVAIYSALALQTSDDFVNAMSLPMQNLLNAQWYVLPLETAPAGEPSPWDESEPATGLTLDLLADAPHITPTPTTQVEIVSFTDGTRDLPDGFRAGELTLTFEDGRTQTRALRLGTETADWTSDVAPIQHRAPQESQTFAAYLSTFGREFTGRKFIARWEVPPANVVSISARSFLPGAGLTIERVVLHDASGKGISLAQLLRRHDLTLAFRSHIIALWENRDALPRAFIAPRAEFANDAITLANMQHADFQPRQIVWLNESHAQTIPEARAENTRAEIVEYTPMRVTVRATTDAAAYLVLSDAWFPGWIATLDGVPTSIVRADVMLRSVALEPGTHTIVFEYRSDSFRLGALVSAMAWLLVGICLVVVWIRHD